MDKNYTKHHLLDFINPKTHIENDVNPLRCLSLSDKDVSKMGGFDEVIYIMNRNLRVEDNFALNFALLNAEKYDSLFKILVFLDKTTGFTAQKYAFLHKNLNVLFKNLESNKIDFEYVFDDRKNLIKRLPKKKNVLIVSDFNPLFHSDLDKDDRVVFVDAFNIVPAFYADDSLAYNAASLRRKIYKKIYDFLTEFPKKSFEKNNGYELLDDFLKTKLSDYALHKNNPVLDVVSRLSPYLNNGFLSSQRVALEVLKSDNSRENKEAFLEELVVRKELSDNFCFYNKNFKSFEGLPAWAKFSLNRHKNDLRNFLYSTEELENAKTADLLWNASQNQLKQEGRIHGYMRMYWAKQIANWSVSPQEAIDKAIYLNDKYGFDAPSCNGYVGILWSIGGLHDRPFQDRLVSGKIRSMTYNGAKSKFNVQEYIKRYG